VDTGTTDTHEERIVGSAEPLTPEQRAARLQELKAWGIDLSLVQSNLRMTPTERLLEARNLRVVAAELRRGMQRYQAERLAAILESKRKHARG